MMQGRISSNVSNDAPQSASLIFQTNFEQISWVKECCLIQLVVPEAPKSIHFPVLVSFVTHLSFFGDQYKLDLLKLYKCVGDYCAHSLELKSRLILLDCKGDYEQYGWYNNIRSRQTHQSSIAYGLMCFRIVTYPTPISIQTKADQGLVNYNPKYGRNIKD